MPKYILASNSPRRKELMNMLKLDFEVIVADVDETVEAGVAPEDVVMDLAYRKAVKIFKNHPDRIVLGFDTLVWLDGEALGKPKDRADAIRMLTKLSGRTHIVVTGVAVIAKAISSSFYELTEVTFYPMTQSEIEAYADTGEPYDKAGAYAVQGQGAKHIRGVRGDFYTVMGLPLAKLYHELEKLKLL